jgi:predicted nucleotidyltransferase
MKTSEDPILKRFRAALDEMYGARLERAVLFGSRARGDASEDLDYDVAVFCTISRKVTSLGRNWPARSRRPVSS